MRMFFPKTICYRIEEVLKAPVISARDKPLFFNIALHEKNSRSRHVLNVYKTIDAGAIPWKLIVNCLKDPAAGGVPVPIT